MLGGFLEATSSIPDAQSTLMQAQEDRNKVLESAAEHGVIRDYSALRQSLKGKRFQIRNCTLFNLETPTGKKVAPL